MIMYSAIHESDPSFILELKFDDGTIKKQFITLGTRLKISYYKGYDTITKTGIVKGIGKPIRIEDSYDKHGQVQALRNDKFGDIGPNYVYMTGIPSPHNNSLMHLDPHNTIHANPVRIPPYHKNNEEKKPMPPYHAHMDGECVYNHDYKKNYDMKPHESVLDIPKENLFLVLCMDFSKDYQSDMDHIPTTNIRDIELVVSDKKMELFNYYNDSLLIHNKDDKVWTEESYKLFDRMRTLVKYVLDNPKDENVDEVITLFNNTVMGLVPLESEESKEPIPDKEPPKDDENKENNDTDSSIDDEETGGE